MLPEVVRRAESPVYLGAVFVLALEHEPVRHGHVAVGTVSLRHRGDSGP